VSAIAAVTATFYIPPKIAEGLASGTLERIGGVVREAGTKKVVAWLREIPGAQVIPNPFSLIILPLKPGSSTIGIANLLATMRGFRQMNLRLDQIEHLIHINTAVSALTLGTAVAGFSVINHRLNKIENRLEAMQEQLNEIGQKVDLGFYATFKAALDMAQRAFSMDDAHNRKAMALRAIQSFAESEHIYGAYLDQALKNQDRAVNEYLTKRQTTTNGNGANLFRL
jgi:tetrahydromethanopterin S-methyltransferase subunit G